MKKVLVVSLMVLSFSFAWSQIPNVQVKDISGKNFSTEGITNDGKPIIISFWATWCKPCVKELSAIAEVYEDWQEETGVKLVAVSIDNSRSMSKVAPFINGKAWEYEVLLDPNSEFKRAMNVVNVPHVFLIDGKGNIVDQHTSYADGDENELYEKVKKVAAGKAVNE
ncbi:MAG: TlpA family protein disulfide reductase [Bacteroidales bacterium]|nr:TlpA family protein disulfide reductase [Bacteroidales bacterium]MCF8457694.1 TlpA family protein disulfide reductase [Bacteroidales bacterium]